MKRKNDIFIKAAKTMLFILILYRIIISGSFFRLMVLCAAVAIHELFHLICAKFLGLNVSFSGVGLFGLMIDFDGRGSVSEKMLVYSGGIIGNLFVSAMTLVAMYRYSMDMSFFLEYNLLMAAINLIPAYPLDGGRIMESILAHFSGNSSAVKITAMSGTLIGSVMFIFGIFMFMFYTDNLILPVLGIFLIYNSDREVKMMNVGYVKSLLGNMNDGNIDLRNTL